MPRIRRRDFLKMSGAAVAGGATAGCYWQRRRAAMQAQAAAIEAAADPARRKSANRRPNVLLILVDDLGYGDLSSYGAPDMKTPHIDALVAGGMRFDYGYANCPVCSPTRAALLSGRYQELVGVPGVIRTHPNNSWGHLTPEAALLPAVLKPAGYKTAIVGKWHLGLESPNKPNDRGFDHFHGFLGDMMDDYYNHRRHKINYMRSNEAEIDPEGHATDLFTQWACDYLRKQKAGEPFFLYLAYNAPHSPIQPPPEWLERVRKREPGIDDKRAKLVALIEHLDEGIGKVLAMLKETGLEDDTLVIFTSDNGGQISVGANNGPVRDGKGTLYEGGIRVPLCARWPGRIEAGSRSDRIVLSMDLMPTVCEAAGATIGHEIEGLSILPTLRGEKQAVPKRDVFFGRREGGRHRGGHVACIRRGDWKLLQPLPDKPYELYNLAADPLEKNDLAKTDPAKFNELKSALDAQLARYAKVPWKPPGQRE